MDFIRALAVGIVLVVALVIAIYTGVHHLYKLIRGKNAN